MYNVFIMVVGLYEKYIEDVLQYRCYTRAKIYEIVIVENIILSLKVV